MLLASGEGATFGAGVYFADADTEKSLGIECQLSIGDQISVATRYEIPEPGGIRSDLVQAWIELEIPRRMQYVVKQYSNPRTLATEIVLSVPLFWVSFYDDFDGGQLREGPALILSDPGVRVVRGCLDGGIFYD